MNKNNQTQIKVNFEGDTVWLNQKQMAALFQKDRTVIGRHINNVFKEGELEKKVVCADFAHTTQHGAIKGKQQETKVKFYNLDVIISVGYKVKSKQGTQFRQWATKLLKDYLSTLEELKELLTTEPKYLIDEFKEFQKAPKFYKGV